MSERSGDGATAVLSAAVDWITCTARQGVKSGLLSAAGWGAVYAEAELGNDLKPWLWKGYDGYMAGSAAVGNRADGSICRISGHRAALAFRSAVRNADSVSRLDLAVTVRLAPDANPAVEVYQAVRRALPGQRGRRVQKATHIQTWNEGETCYLGSRQSARFGRIYNKGLESGMEEYRDAWRWEVEYKGDAGTALASALAQSGDTPTAVAAYVARTFEAWGVKPEWADGSVVADFHSPRNQTDDGSRLAWLSAQVRPVVARLIAKGRRAEVLAALGLEE